MPTTLSNTDVANVALAKIGAQPIGSLSDLTNQSAIICNTSFLLAYLEVTRAGRWNCLLNTAILVQEPQTPLPGPVPPSPAPNWEINTFYATNTYLTYGGYVYIVMYDYTSTNNFFNDLTTGALTQTNYPTIGYPFFPGNPTAYPSGWAFKYALPDDFQLLAVLNQNTYWSTGGSGMDYQIMGSDLFCNWNEAIIQYVPNVPDTTRWDSLFVNAVTLKLASMIATPLRQDGGKIEALMLQAYQGALREARVKNGNESQRVRFNPIERSVFLAARYRGRNG